MAAMKSTHIRQSGAQAQGLGTAVIIIASLSTGLGLLPLAQGAGGPLMVTGGWLLGGAFALILAACLGQIASAFPTAGGLYQWSSMLGGRRWGWFTGCTQVLGLLLVIASVNVMLYSLIRDLLWAGLGRMDVSGWTAFSNPGESQFGHGLLWLAGLTLVQSALNHFFPRATLWLIKVLGYLIFACTSVVVALLLMHVKTFSFAGTFAAIMGDTGATMALADGPWVALMLGSLCAILALTGVGAAAQGETESPDAQRLLPHSLLRIVCWSLALGFVLTLALVLARPAAGALTGGGKAFDAAALLIPLLAGSLVGKLCAFGLVAATFMCGVVALTFTSRLIHGLARDGGLPRLLAKADETRATPAAAIWATGLLSFLLIVVSAPLHSFTAMLTGCAVFLYIASAMPILAGLVALDKSWIYQGPFTLGRWFKPLGFLGLMGGVGLVIGSHAFLPSAGDGPGLMFYALGFYGLLALIWLGFARKHFKAPPLGDEMARRLALIEAQNRWRLHR